MLCWYMHLSETPVQTTQNNNNKTALWCLTHNDATFLFKIICRWVRLLSPWRLSALFLWFWENRSHRLTMLNKRGKTVFPVSLRVLYPEQLRWEKKGLRWDFTRYYAKTHTVEVQHCRSQLDACLSFYSFSDRWNMLDSLCLSTNAWM